MVIPWTSCPRRAGRGDTRAGWNDPNCELRTANALCMLCAGGRNSNLNLPRNWNPLSPPPLPPDFIMALGGVQALESATLVALFIAQGVLPRPRCVRTPGKTPKRGARHNSTSLHCNDTGCSVSCQARNQRASVLPGATIMVLRSSLDQVRSRLLRAQSRTPQSSYRDTERGGGDLVSALVSSSQGPGVDAGGRNAY